MTSVSKGPIAKATYVHDTMLDLGSIQEVPDSNAWSELDDCLRGDSSDVECLPVIDLNDPNIMSLIGHACETWRMFQITGHGIPIDIIDGLGTHGHRFFSLPMEQKLKAERAPGEFSGYAQARIGSFFKKTMWSEGLTMVESPVNLVSRVWPDDYVEFCDVMGQAKKEMKALASRIMWLTLSSLGISKEDYDWAEPNGEIAEWTALQLNWYPRCPDPNRAIGIAPHTDSFLITLIHPSMTRGLLVLRENGDQTHWVTVNPVPSSLVVNVGDLLHVLSNGQFRSPLHRALVNREKPRITAVCFLGPPKDVLIGPSPKLVDAVQGPLYRAVNIDEYLELKKMHYQEALDLIKLA